MNDKIDQTLADFIGGDTKLTTIFSTENSSNLNPPRRESCSLHFLLATIVTSYDLAVVYNHIMISLRNFTDRGHQRTAVIFVIERIHLGLHFEMTLSKLFFSRQIAIYFFTPGFLDISFSEMCGETRISGF